MKPIIKIITGLTLLTISSSASAMSYGFDCFTNNSATNCSGTNSVFSFSVAEVMAGEVTFTISHMNSLVAADTGIISEVYIDDNLGVLGTFISTDPTWNLDVSPQNLPSQNNASPPFTTDFSLDSQFSGNDPNPDAPIGPGEELDIVFALTGTLANLITAITNGDLRLGLHVRSIDFGVPDGPGGSSDSSESFVSTVPIPGAVWLLGSAIVGLIGFSRKPYST